ncbi:MAG: hypothetical protein RL119_1556 [Actinomycetota bacterium]
MKTSGIITRTVIATSFLVTLAVPVASAYSDNANLGQSGDVRQDGEPSAAGSENSQGGRNDYWGGCRGVHGGDNPGGGLGNGLGDGYNSGNGDGDASGHDKSWKQCGTTPPPPPSGDGGSSAIPETR